jgi:hypothetical protein
MAGLFEGSAPTPVTLTKTSAAQAPGYLTDYLSKLAQSGVESIGTMGKDATGQPQFQRYTGEELIASQPDYYKNLLTGVGVDQTKLPGLATLSRYQTPMDEALKAGRSAMEVSGGDVSKFYDPFQKDVLSKLEEQAAVNLQRNVAPALKALGVSGGAGTLGGSRVGTVAGQALADFASQLEGQKLIAQQNMYKQALDAALREQAQQTGAAGALATLGGQEQTAATAGLKSLSDIGAAKLAYDQSKVEAPLKRALNVAEIMRGYTYPTTSTETAQTLPTTFAPSPLQQIAGLGTLVGAAFPSGGGGIGSKIIGGIENIFGGIGSGGWGSLGSLTGGGTPTGDMGDFGT